MPGVHFADCVSVLALVTDRQSSDFAECCVVMLNYVVRPTAVSENETL